MFEWTTETATWKCSNDHQWTGKAIQCVVPAKAGEIQASDLSKSGQRSKSQALCPFCIVEHFAVQMVFGAKKVQ